MSNVIITVREYIVKSQLTLNVVVEKKPIFRNIFNGKKEDVENIGIKENDKILKINNSFYLKQGDFDYILLDVKDDFIKNNPKIFELKEVEASVKH